MAETFYRENFRIGGAVFRSNIMLAPMAGVTDRAFRVLCREQGAGVTFTEMISAKGVHYDGRKSIELAELDESERPAAVQIFGSDPDIMAEAAMLFARGGAAMIDINMGCPMPKIVNNGDGSALMKDPALAERIVAAVVAAVGPLGVPVSVKMRRGFDSKRSVVGGSANGSGACSGSDSGNAQAVELALACEAGGASMITIHGRYRDQLYSGAADLGVISEVKSSLHIPVIGNGDVRTPADAFTMFRETGCDGIMIGRAARGNPWIFSDVIRALRGDAEDAEVPGGRDTPEGVGTPEGLCTQGDAESAESRDTLEGVGTQGSAASRPLLETMLRHLDMEISFKGEYTAIREMRGHLAWYLRGLRGSAAVKNRIFRCESAEEMRGLLREYFRG